MTLEIIRRPIARAHLSALAEAQVRDIDSMINVRPSRGNRSRGVDDSALRERIRQVVGGLVEG